MINEQRLRGIIRKIILKKYKDRVLSEGVDPKKILESISLKEQEEMSMGQGSVSYAIRRLNILFGKIIEAKNDKGNQLESLYMGLEKPEYRKSFIKHVVQGYYDLLAPKLTSAMPLESFLQIFPQRRQDFINKKKKAIGSPLSERLNFKLDADGLPGTDTDENFSKTEEDADEERKDAILGDPKTEDVPEDQRLQGEHSFGRKAANMFISGSITEVMNAINGLIETDQEREQREREGEKAPIQEFLEYFFINLMLYCWQFENEHFNSSFDEVEEFYREVSDAASYQKEQIAKSASPEDVDQEAAGGMEPEEELNLSL